ncbi:hypothetical protein [Dyadobacter sp. MSC1_007]|uniref:hypothetical protein n=1 Tax=Dyadobacter sp. MSC1_007 TaxID=2909264 RepID=UPI0020300A24|nr:hypothetical protein [Dyadobacter sp. MSC1_007]
MCNFYLVRRKTVKFFFQFGRLFKTRFFYLLEIFRTQKAIDHFDAGILHSCINLIKFFEQITPVFISPLSFFFESSQNQFRIDFHSSWARNQLS